MVIWLFFKQILIIYRYRLKIYGANDMTTGICFNINLPQYNARGGGVDGTVNETQLALT